MDIAAKSPRHKMARFPRLRELRIQLGWEVADLASKLGGKPSVSSIYRLEDGHAIRLVSVIRVFEVINAAHRGGLVRTSEIIIV